MTDATESLRRLYPEIAAGGYSRVDGTVAFYSRVNALLSPSMTVLNFGAGRGAAVSEDPVEYRRALQLLKGRVKEVIGVDIDPVVLSNPAVDRAFVTLPMGRMPLPDESVDVIVSDYCLEHVGSPASVARELDRVLKPGGWICARTPNRWGYIAIAARLVPNCCHVTALATLQPGRKAVDVFPTRYRLNTAKDLARYFPLQRFRHCVYGHNGPPAYFGSRLGPMRLARSISRLTPERLFPTLLVFIQKVEVPTSSEI